MARLPATSTQPGVIPAATSFLGPLPTTFSAPTTCGTITSTWIADANITIWEIAPQTSNDPTCLPSNWIINGYYSPGLCPYGYTNACSLTANDVETTICCPTNQNFGCHSTPAYGKFVCSSSVPPTIMTLAELAPRDVAATFQGWDQDAHPYSEHRHSPHTGVSNSEEVYNGIMIDDGTTVIGDMTIASDMTIIGGHTFNADADTGSILPPSPSSTLASRTTEFPGHTLWAYSIRIHKGASAASIPISSPSGFPTTSFTTAISSQVGSGSPSMAPFPNSGLSTPAIVGIAVGIIGALILGAVGSYLFMRGRRIRNGALSPHLEPYPKPVDHLSLNSRHELDEQRTLPEMPAWDERYSRGPNRPMAWELPAHSNERGERDAGGPKKPMAWELPA
ncbi:hypothetical protein F5Y13DRAFT_156410 [Hypoxylon sp. FL1857]|nr:hypothetical protein F5Y13DRAFT_156410 [Hypoxylon sp. FL1857]